MKKLLFIISMFIFTAASFAAVKKQNLRVLYVGGSGDHAHSARLKDKAAPEDVAARMAAFTELLNSHFTTVKAVNGSDYTSAMSADYDVTIFDGMPKPIKDRKYVKDENGKVVDYQPAEYLPESFDRAAICIADISEALCRPLGIKNDWYCLCLDADAHSLVKNHPIFKGPFKTSITMFDAPTPEDAFHYTYFYDKPLEATTPRWKVQTIGYMTDKKARVGMVSRPWGYVESSETEYISSGVCAKTIDAVAIGRHANFLHWGFAASPKYMTDEAKEVFANAVVYISKFNGVKPIVRKYNERQSTKLYIRECKHNASKAGWEERVKTEREWAEEVMKEKKKAQEKQKKGETLTESEKLALQIEPADPPTYEEWLKKRQKGLFEKFGTDEQKYLDYYDQNYDYFYGGGKEMYHLEIDEDAKSLGIANTDKRLIDKAISLWETGSDVEKAKRILYRYTLLRYDNAKQWRDWYKKYQKKLFFTQAGGWFWLVDNGDPTTPGNDYSIIKN